MKGIIEQLLKNQKSLQDQINDLFGANGDKDKRIENLEKEVKYLKETYVNKSDLQQIKEKLKVHDKLIEESKLYIFIDIFFLSSFKKIETN